MKYENAILFAALLIAALNESCRSRRGRREPSSAVAAVATATQTQTQLSHAEYTRTHARPQRRTQTHRLSFIYLFTSFARFFLPLMMLMMMLVERVRENDVITYCSFCFIFFVCLFC